jgi:hypothetical protein
MPSCAQSNHCTQSRQQNKETNKNQQQTNNKQQQQQQQQIAIVTRARQKHRAVEAARVDAAHAIRRHVLAACDDAAFRRRLPLGFFFGSIAVLSVS